MPGNAWVAWVLASAVPGSPNYDATNDSLLNQGATVLTLDLTQGEGIDPVALLAGAERAKQQLLLAATIKNLSHDPDTGALSFQVQNNTAHKLISGFAEGRRMFVNIKAYAGGALSYEVNPYELAVGTLKGLPSAYSPNSPALEAGVNLASPPVELQSGGALVVAAGHAAFQFGGKVDLAGTKNILAAALDAGVNLIDTADIYQSGRSETNIGEALKGRRERALIATKVFFKVGDGPNDQGASRQHIVDGIEASLRRLQTDHVDLLLLHILDKREDVLREDYMKIFDAAKKKGKTRYVGISTHANQGEVLDAAVESKFLTRAHLSL